MRGLHHLGNFLRPQPQGRQRHKENLGLALLQLTRLVAVARALEVHAVDVHTLAGCGDRLLLEYFEGEVEHIDWDAIAARVVLRRACQEGVGEEETRKPKGLRNAALDPVGEHGEPVEQVGDVACERFE
eukprot:scaffold6363_cov25-Tisochrysis_lutea.AAC.11